MSNAAVAEPDVVTEDAVPETTRRTRTVHKNKPKRQPPYAVIVHNDDEHTFYYVADLLMKVCGHDRQRAWLLTNQVHTAGKAVVWTGPLEVAELKRDQIRGGGPDHFASKPVTFPLGVTIEPLPSE